MKANRLLKAQRRAELALAAAAARSRKATELAARRVRLKSIDEGLHELGRLRSDGRISEEEFAEERQRLMCPVLQREVMA